MANYTGVALLGNPGSGKTTIAKALAEICDGQLLSFSGALKDELADMLGRGSPGFAAFHRTRQSDPATKDLYRPLQQALGAFRRQEDADFWVRIALAGVRPDRFYVSDDCRYWNEYSALRRAGFAFVRLGDGPYTRKMTPEQAAHSSEQDWPDFLFDYHLPFTEGAERGALMLAMALGLMVSKVG